MSIVRIGLGENNKFAAGYDAIFGGKQAASAKPKTAKGKAAKAKAKTAKAKKTTTKKKKK